MTKKENQPVLIAFDRQGNPLSWVETPQISPHLSTRRQFLKQSFRLVSALSLSSLLADRLLRLPHSPPAQTELSPSLSISSRLPELTVFYLPPPQFSIHLKETLPPVRQLPDYPQLINQIISSPYQPEFYTPGTFNLNPSLLQTVDQLKNSSHPQVESQVQALAHWYLNQIYPLIVVDQNTSLGLRMADLALALSPQLKTLIDYQISLAVNHQQHHSLSHSVTPKPAPVSSASVEASFAPIVDNRLSENTLSDSSSLPPSLAPFVSPQICFSPSVWAAYIHSQFLIGSRLASSDIPQTWQVLQTQPLADFSSFAKYLPPLPSLITDKINIVYLQQQNCQTPPCQATALVFGDLLLPGQSFQITTVTEKIIKLLNP